MNYRNKGQGYDIAHVKKAIYIGYRVGYTIFSKPYNQ